MSRPDRQRVGYVVKMYPRLAETFILNEILAHEAAGRELEIFSLRSPVDGKFHRDLGRVQADVTYIPGHTVKAEDFWTTVSEAGRESPIAQRIWEDGRKELAGSVNQAIHLARAARELGVTHMHAHFATIATTVTRLASRLTGVPYSFTAHAKDIYHESVQDDDMTRKLRDASSVVTVSDFNRDYLRNRFGPVADGVRRIYNGLDLQDFSYTPPDGRPPLILGVGRLVEKKGFADLIRACSILRDRNREFECEIIGGGVLRKDLAELITELNLSACVRMLGPTPREEVNRRMGQAAVLAAPCVVSPNGNRDGLPTVLLEAMAVGTPCISTPVTGIPELVRDGDTGLLAAERDPRSLADALQRLLDDRGLGLALAASARRRIESDFDIHRNTVALRELFSPASAELTPRRAVEVG